MSDHKVSRRKALGSVGAVVAGTVAGSAIAGQTPAAQRGERAPWEPPVPLRVAPRDELVNLLEFEEEAKKKLQPAMFAQIAGGDRCAV